MFIALLVIGYLIAGLVSGSAVSRLGYAIDKDVREAAARLDQANTAYLEFRSKNKASDVRYSAAGTELESARSNASKIFSANKKNYTVLGSVTLALWPVVFVFGGLFFAGRFLIKIVGSGVVYALRPQQYEAHERLLNQAVSK